MLHNFIELSQWKIHMHDEIQMLKQNHKTEKDNRSKEKEN